MAVVKIIKVIHKLLKLGNSRASCTHSFIQQDCLAMMFVHTYGIGAH